MLRFSEYEFIGIILYLTLKKIKNIKIYKNVGVATKAPPCLNLKQNGHFLEHGLSNFYETFDSGFFDFKQIHNSTKINKISCKIKYLAQIVIFGPPTDPLTGFSF